MGVELTSANIADLFNDPGLSGEGGITEVGASVIPTLHQLITADLRCILLVLQKCPM